MNPQSSLQKIGVLTGGGDSSGINALLHGICLEARQMEVEVIGFIDGWKGVLGNNYVPLSLTRTFSEVNSSGTILGTSRTNPYRQKGQVRVIAQNVKDLDLDGLIVIGGNDTLTVASKIANDLELKVVGIPQTIDNDVPATDYCVGFNTAVHNVVASINNVRATCQSHKEDIVVEVMGRESGWIAGVAGLTASSEFILLPEMSFAIQNLVEKLKLRHQQGFNSNVIVVAEGVKGFDHRKIEAGTDAFGNVMLAGIGLSLRDYLQDKLQRKTRAIVLSYIQRGGIPTAYEVFMALGFGRKAIKLLFEGQSNLMVAYSNGCFKPEPLASACGIKGVTPELIAMVREMTFL